MIETLVLVVHVLVAAAIIGLVLLQHGRGADMGAAFGSGASGTLFGASGSANFLSRATAVLATVFFVSSVGLTYLGTRQSGPKGLIQGSDAPASTQAPAPAIPGPNPSDVPKPSTGAAPAGTPAAPGAPTGAAPAAGGAAPQAPTVPLAPADGSKVNQIPK